MESRFEELQKQINYFELKYGDNRMHGELTERQIDGLDNAIEFRPNN